MVIFKMQNKQEWEPNEKKFSVLYDGNENRYKVGLYFSCHNEYRYFTDCQIMRFIIEGFSPLFLAQITSVAEAWHPILSITTDKRTNISFIDLIEKEDGHFPVPEEISREATVESLIEKYDIRVRK